MVVNVIFKCRKCRTVLLTHPDTSVISAHGAELCLKNSNLPKVEFVDKSSNIASLQCSSLDINKDVFYILESSIPDWMTNCINKGNWTRGKLMCPGCVGRVGFFDFVSGFRCGCQVSVVPPIHLVKSKVDYTPCNVNIEEKDTISS